MLKNENRAFDEMLRAARLRLAGRDPARIAANAQAAYDPARSALLLRSLNEDVSISLPDLTLYPEMDPWWQMVILHYLDMADGAPLSKELLAFGAQREGMARGGGFDRDCERILGARLGKCDPACIEAACVHLGAEILPSNADLCAVFPFLPRYPITLKLWFADEEMEASGRLFLSGSAGHYLSVEDSVAAGTILLEALLARIPRGCAHPPAGGFTQ